MEPQKPIIPEVTLRRFARYLSFVQAMRKEGWDFVTSSDMARACNVTEILVRKDLSNVHAHGRPNAGYATAELIEALSSRIGWNVPRGMAFVGPRALARMMMKAFPFARYGVSVTDIVPSDALAAFAARQKTDPVRMALLAEPVERAQTACDALVSAGITAIWNFTPVTLTVPEGVCVVDADFAADLAVLCQSQV